jgi:pimeloyl-ACP methyl ester carboxylesterase
MLQHFRGNLDNWDPALTDALAANRTVILVDYPGAGGSTGEFGPTIADTARRTIAFVEALGVSKIDLLGFSIGGFVAQEIALIRPALVRRLILAATGPKGAPGMHGWQDDIAHAAREQARKPAVRDVRPQRQQPGKGERLPPAVHGANRRPRPPDG